MTTMSATEHPSWCDRRHQPGEAHAGATAYVAGVALERTLGPRGGADLVRLGTYVGDTDALLTVPDRRRLIAYLTATLPEHQPAHATRSGHSARAIAGAR